MNIDQKRALDDIWNGTNAYINSADIVVVERKRLIKILFDLCQYRFGNKKRLTLLDIGCGDGILSKYIQSKSPENTFYLLDGSYRMLEKAKQNIQGPNVFYIHQTFEEYISAESDGVCYDFIYSANAIHHLDLPSKSRLYAKIFQELKEGGLFINIDPVLPSSELSEQWQFSMWRDWMNETLQNSGLKDQIGKYDELLFNIR